MPTETAFLNCPNPSCQRANSEDLQDCHNCGTRLVKRYLWATSPDLRPLGNALDFLEVGQRMGDRYLYKGNHIFLDLKPGVPPHIPSEISTSLQTYLKLFPYRLHLPQPYELLTLKSTLPPVLLLEGAPINPSLLDQAPLNPPLMPTLKDQWAKASPMRQLHWLWQIAHLWQPLKVLGVANSLLDHHFLRVEGPVVRIRELRADPSSSVELSQLGQMWLLLAKQANPLINRFLQHLAQGLTEGQIFAMDRAISELDRALHYCRQSQTTHFSLCTASDKGPSRSHNEDACYPLQTSPGQSISSFQGSDPLCAIVCDGIGGHAGGEVASQQAIESILASLNWDKLSAAKSPLERVDRIVDLLDRLIRHANTVISDRNDQEHRHERQRMGTTLVMAVVPPPVEPAHELYIAHVGDSRIYWITQHGCHQVTLDDDLASREVRLGYTLYRGALQHRAAGALVQALGMSESSLLHPTVGRLILDEDGIVLLCSDGLSDGDRVEHHWQSKLLPILEGKLDLATATAELVELANTLNGHDNVTIGLIHYQVKPQKATLKPLTQLFHPIIQGDRPVKESVQNSMKTQLVTVGAPEDHKDLKSNPNSQPQTVSISRLLVGIASLITILFVLGGAILYLFEPSWRRSPTLQNSPAIPVQPSPSPSPINP